jgi:hypothetical protein
MSPDPLTNRPRPPYDQAIEEAAERHEVNVQPVLDGQITVEVGAVPE